MGITAAITTVKRDVQLQEWTEQRTVLRMVSILRHITIVFVKFGSSVWNLNRQ